MNKTQSKFLFLAIFIGILLSGCASWQYINTDNTRWKSSPLEARLPKGWVKYNSPLHLLFLTKDGVLLQRVTISSRNIDKELKLSKKKMKENMLTQEIAEIALDELTLNQELKNFKLLENKPTNIAGMDGFKLVFTFNNADFLKYETILYGFLRGKKYYEIEYTATKQHYFDKGVNDFEAFMNNIVVAPVVESNLQAKAKKQK